MGIKKTLAEILAGTALALGISFAGNTFAQEIAKPEIIKPVPVEEKVYERKPKQEKEAKQEKVEPTAEPFDSVELCEGETPASTMDKKFKTGQLRLNAFNSKDLNRLDASVKLVFAGENGSRFNLYSLVSDIENKGGKGDEDLNTTFQRHGIGAGKYWRITDIVFYPELQAFYERADHESEPTGKVNLTRNNLLLGGKLGCSNTSTGTKALVQGLFGEGDAEGRISKTKPYDGNISRLRLGFTLIQRLTRRIQEDKAGLCLRLDALIDKTNYEKLQDYKLLSLRLGMPYVVRFKDDKNDKSLTAEPFLAWRREQTDSAKGKDGKDYFGGGIVFKYRVGNFELCFIPGYDEEHGLNTNIGLVWYFGAKESRR